MYCIIVQAPFHLNMLNSIKTREQPSDLQCLHLSNYESILHSICLSDTQQQLVLVREATNAYNTCGIRQQKWENHANNSYLLPTKLLFGFSVHAHQ